MINLGLLLIGIMQMIYGLHGIIDYYIRDNKNKVENNSEKYAYIIIDENDSEISKIAMKIETAIF